MSDFSKIILEAFDDSRYAHCVAQREGDPEFQSADRACHDLFSAIHERLGEDGKLMLRFEEHYNERRDMEERHIYLQALRDCVTLLRIIKLI